MVEDLQALVTSLLLEGHTLDDGVEAVGHHTEPAAVVDDDGTPPLDM